MGEMNKSRHFKFIVGGTETGLIDLDAWFKHYGKYWTEAERREYEEEILNDWKERHGQPVQRKLFG